MEQVGEMLGNAAPGCEERCVSGEKREGVTSKGGQFVNEEATRHMLFTASVNVFVSFRNFSAAVSSKAKLRW
jgi:hypothetical protein